MAGPWLSSPFQSQFGDFEIHGPINPETQLAPGGKPSSRKRLKLLARRQLT